MASGIGNTSKRNKILHKRGLLSDGPIENEYENLDEDDEVDEDNPSENVIQTVFQAQEPATVTQYDDIKITPFNLEEELEDGEFDKTGNFIFKKAEKSDYDKIDTWADTVDWDVVQRKERERVVAMTIGSDKDEESQPQEVRNRSTCYRQLLRILRPDETVQKAIKRVGDEIPKRRPIQKSKNKPKSTQCPVDKEKIAEARKKLDLMIELAHFLLEDGDTDIYQKSYEDLELSINL